MVDLSVTPSGITDSFSKWRENKTDKGKSLMDKEPLKFSFNSTPSDLWDPSLIVGDGDVHDQMRQMVSDLDAWRRGEMDWSDMVTSMIIEGEPGTGKTYLAHQVSKCIGEERSILTSYAEWQGAKDGHLGHFLAAMKECFDEAIKNKPAFLFIDEIDSFGSRSGGSKYNSSYNRKAVNGFLAQLDMNRLEGVIVVGACNDTSDIDPAILRDGRFDEHLNIDLPGPKAIAKMISGALEGLASEAEITEASKALTGVTPASIHGTIRKMKTECRRKKVDFCLHELLRRVLPPEELRETIWRRVALHECGHAIVSKALGLGEVKRVFMRSDGSGYALSQPAITEYLVDDLDACIAGLMAGRAAEELVLGNASGGAGGSVKSDIAKANSIAVSIEVKLGLGSQGHLYCNLKDGEWHQDEAIRSKVLLRVSDGLGRARAILDCNREVLSKMAEDLVHERILSGERLAQWLERIPLQKQQQNTQRMTSAELINRLEDCSFRFRLGKVTVDARSAARSADQVLLPLARIGWKYGLRRMATPGRPDLLTACAEGIDAISTGLPDNGIISLENLNDFAKHLSDDETFRPFEDLVENGEAVKILLNASFVAQARINLEELSRTRDSG